jgi:HlyD family secretion protein
MAKSRSYGGLIITLVVLAAAAGGGWYYWTVKNNKPPVFTTTAITRGRIVQQVTATGILQNFVSVDVSSQVSGNIIEVDVDFNTPVKKDQVLCKLDPSTYEQALKQAKANLESAKAQAELARATTARERDLFAKNLVAQADLDSAIANLAQAESSLVTNQAQLDNAVVNLARCTITSPIDGIVLARDTDPGRTVSASTSAPTLFTIVDTMKKLQIDASVAEADIGTVAEGQQVDFTVDAFPGRIFRGVVSQVRNDSKTVSSVVSYDTMIDLENPDLSLKPGMTANVSITVAEHDNVLIVSNNALRVRIPDTLLPAAKTAAAADGKGAPGDQKKASSPREIMLEAGWSGAGAPSADVIEKAQQLAKDRGLTIDFSRFANAGGGGRGGNGGGFGGGGGMGGGGGRGRGGNNNSGGGTVDRTVSNRPRTVYKLVGEAPNQHVEPVSVRLGISDGFTTEVLSNLSEGDVLVTYVTMPDAPAVVTGQPGGTNPFQQGRGGGGGGGGRGGGF